MQILTIHRYPHPRGNDWCWGIEGEVAIPGSACDAPGCGCDRSHIGLNSHKASTTVMVSSTELTRDDLATAVSGYLASAGWGSLPADEIAALVDELAAVAARYPVGAVLRPTVNADGSWTYTPAGGAAQ